MKGGTFCKVTVGALGASAGNVEYNLRDVALVSERPGEDLRAHVLLRHIPDAMTNDMETFADLRQSLVTWAEVRECSEIKRSVVSASPTDEPVQCRSHYRIKLSWSTGEQPSSERALAMTEEFLSKTCPNAPAIAAVHRNTDHVHVHIWIDARQIDESKLTFNWAEWRSIDEKWNQIYCRETGRDPAVHLQKKQASAEYWKSVREIRTKLEARGASATWSDSIEHARVDGTPRPGRYEWTYHVPIDPLVREAVSILNDLDQRSALRHESKRGDDRKKREQALKQLEELEQAIPKRVLELRFFIATEQLKCDDELWLQFVRVARDGAAALASKARQYYAVASPSLLEATPAPPADAATVAIDRRPPFPDGHPELEREICSAVQRPLLHVQLVHLSRNVEQARLEAAAVGALYARDLTSDLDGIWKYSSTAWEKFGKLARQHGVKDAVEMVRDDPKILGMLIPDRKSPYMPEVIHRLSPATFTESHQRARSVAEALGQKWNASTKLESATALYAELKQHVERTPEPKRIAYRLRKSPPELRDAVLVWLKACSDIPWVRELRTEVQLYLDTGQSLGRGGRSRDGFGL